MKFLLDVNASRIAGQWLTERGHDVAYVAGVDPRMPDDEILAWAIRYVSSTTPVPARYNALFSSPSVSRIPFPHQ